MSEKTVSFGINEDMKRAYSVGVKDGVSEIQNTLVARLEAKIAECESAIRDNSMIPDFWLGKKRAFEEILRWLDER